MIKPLDPIISSNLGDIAYKKIADAIISGLFAPGEKLTIRGLAELLGISSTPVRDAVKRLINERALEQRTQKNIRVPIVSPETYREIAQIRVELEGLAASAAAMTVTDEQIIELTEAIAQNERAIADRDWSKATTLNKEFHFAMTEVAQMPILRAILEELWLQIGPPIAAYYRHGGREMIDHHYDILSGLRQHDPVKARKAIEEDIGGVIEGISKFLLDAK